MLKHLLILIISIVFISACVSNQQPNSTSNQEPIEGAMPVIPTEPDQKPVDEMAAIKEPTVLQEPTQPKPIQEQTQPIQPTPIQEPTQPKPIQEPTQPTQIQEPKQSPKTVKEFNVTIFHTSYSPKTFEVNLGDPVRISAISGPGLESHKHGITIDAYNINRAARTTNPSNPEIIEFVADKRGTFTIYCRTCNDIDGWKGNSNIDHPDIRATLVVK